MTNCVSLPLLKDGYVYNSSNIVKDKLFVFGGCDAKGKASNVSQFLDLSDPKEFVKIKDMPRSKAGASIVHSDNKIIIIGGIYDKQCPLNNVDIYDIEKDTWIEVEPIPNPVQGCSLFSQGNRVYCAGGLTSDMRSLSTFGVLDLLEERWCALPDIPSSHSHSGAFLVDNCIYLIGSRTGKLYSNFCDCFDFRANAWRALPAVPIDFKNLFSSCVNLNNSIYLIGGFKENPAQGFSDSVYKFDLKAEKWEKLSNILKPRADFGAFGANNQIVIAGGMGLLKGVASSVEVFNEESKKWSLSDDMPTIHASSTVCRNENSMVLVSGMSMTGPSKNVTKITV